MENIQIKPILSDVNIPLYKELFRACFKKDMDEKYFRWKYFENPCGSVAGFDAIDEANGKIAAFYGMVPELYMVNGKVTKVYQSMDTMTHPEYQKRGLFVKTAQATFDRILEKEGVNCFIGFPNPNSHPGFVRKLGWKTITSLRYQFAISYYTRLRNFATSFSSISIIRYNDLNEKLKSILKAQNHVTSISKILNPEIFQWRIFNNPQTKYFVYGLEDKADIKLLIVLQNESSVSLRITWIYAPELSYYSVYLKKLLLYVFKKHGCRYISTYHNPYNSIVHDALKSCGFVLNPFRSGPYLATLPFIILFRGSQSSIIDFYDPKLFDFYPIMLDF